MRSPYCLSIHQYHSCRQSQLTQAGVLVIRDYLQWRFSSQKKTT